jgi:cytochrome c oxidase cbb3-type subunit 3
VNTTLSSRLFCLLLALSPVAVRAQDHIEPADKMGKAPRATQGPVPGRPPRPGGGASEMNAEEIAEMRRIMTIPSELEKGRLAFESHCTGCHGPKGEGGRGPTLAQPSLPRAGQDVDLLRIIQRGIPGTEMPSVRLKTGEAPYLAAFVRSLGNVPQEPVKGNPAKGAELFATKGACLTCHSLNGKGQAIGPDLTNIGQRRSPTFLRTSIVDPGAQVPQSFNSVKTEYSMPENFVFVQVKSKTGQEVAGVRVNENTFSIQLRDLTGAMYSFYKSELVELKKNKGMSPMPSYAGALSPTELDDMVAFLVSLREKPKS